MQIRDVMTRGVECVRPDTTVQEAAAQMKELDVGLLPVCDDDRLAGMITDRDITVRCTAQGADPIQTRVRDVMTPEVFYCFEDQDAADAARVMKEKQVRRLPVLNSDKRLIGIVSLGDIATNAGDMELAGKALEGVSRLFGSAAP